MRTERENLIAGFEHNTKYSNIGGNVNTTRSERTPYHKSQDNLKGIIHTENYVEAKRDSSPAGLTPVKNNPLNDEMSLSDFKMQDT